MAPRDDEAGAGISRRTFIGTLGAGAAGLLVPPVAEAAGASARVVAAGATVEVTLRVNGQAHRLEVEPRWTLLHALREVLQLTGTKPGCERGECGACTVLIDGLTRNACMTLAVEVEGREIRTIEGTARPDRPTAVAQAFVDEDAFQCGYCTPGQVMAAEGLLARTPEPTLEEIRTGMSGNLCRCGAYPHILTAVARAAAERRGGRP